MITIMIKMTCHCRQRRLQLQSCLIKEEKEGGERGNHDSNQDYNDNDDYNGDSHDCNAMMLMLKTITMRLSYNFCSQVD